MSEERDIPTGRFARLSRIARVGARSGLSILGRTDGSAAAEQALELLGNLRGLAAKVGQMASYVDGLVPEGQREAYERILSGLQRATAHSPFEKVRAVLEAELGAPIEQLFAELDPQPLASASIGQVHRARLHDGLEVAVKVQHPGIEAAIESDLTSAGTMASVFGQIGPKAMGVRAVHDELAARFREELDYLLEAERQRLFGSLFAEHPRIHVPRVIDSHSRRRVLTSELARGASLDDVAQRSEAERQSYAELLWHFVFEAILVHGVFNADPHPGNYLFHDDGSITFLDFGCVQVLAPEFLNGARGMHRAAIARDEAAFRVAATRACHTVPGPYEDELVAYLWRCLEPLKHSPYRIERNYVADVVQSTQLLGKHALRRSSKLTPPPPGVMLMNRLQFGFYSVLARLDVACDFAAIERELLAKTTMQR